MEWIYLQNAKDFQYYFKTQGCSIIIVKVLEIYVGSTNKFLPMEQLSPVYPELHLQMYWFVAL